MLLNELLEGHRIILASQSPRRKTLIEGLDISFEVIVRDGINEDYPDYLGMMEIPEYLARMKSDNYLDLLNDKTIVISADTIVCLKQKVIGKPADINDAFQIIRELSGNMHEVITGVCLRSSDRIRLFSSLSKVWFRSLSDEEIRYYVNKYKPMDKAGAYGIQEWIGYAGIERIEGSFYNVMGLPVQALYQELSNFIKN
jgi:septum formation protein